MPEQVVYFSLDWWQIFLAGLSTLAIYSFLVKENPFFRFFEHFYIGIATGIGIIAGIRTFLWPEVLKLMLGFNRMPYPDGTYPESYNQAYLLLLIPMAFGSLYYFILSSKHNWLAQVVIGFQLGYTGGNAFKGVLNEIIPQLNDSFRPLYIPGDLGGSISNVIFIITLLSVLSYFIFSFKLSEGGVLAKSAFLGRWMMMGCFGAFFGTTIMARMALFVERLSFLINEWWVIF